MQPVGRGVSKGLYDEERSAVVFDHPARPDAPNSRSSTLSFAVGLNMFVLAMNDMLCDPLAGRPRFFGAKGYAQCRPKRAHRQLLTIQISLLRTHCSERRRHGEPGRERIASALSYSSV